MSQAEMFLNLGAPLNNIRWSWGSVRDSDGVVFLRVWQDGTKKIDKKRYIWISYESPPENDLGAKERLKHTKLIQDGNACYLIMCEAVDAKSNIRVVKSFNRRELFETGEVILYENSYWIEIKGRVDVNKYKLK